MSTTRCFLIGAIPLAAILAAGRLPAGEDEAPAMVDRTYDVLQDFAKVPDDRVCQVEFLGRFWIRTREERNGTGPGTIDIGAGESVDTSLLGTLPEILPRLPGWREDGEIRFEPRGRLQVVQPPEVQARVAAFLEELRAKVLRSTWIEQVFAPADLLDEVAPGWRTSGPFLTEAAFGKLLVDPRCRVHTRPVRIGQLSGVRGGERRAFLEDYEVSQTGVIPVLNPVDTVFDGGDCASFQVAAAGEGGRVRLDLLMQNRILESREVKISSYFGPFDLPTIEENVLWLSATLPVGRPFVAGEVSGGPAGKEGMLCVVRALPSEGVKAAPSAPSAPSTPAGRTVRIHDVPAGMFPPIAKELWGYRRPETMDFGGDEEQPARGSFGEMLGEFREDVEKRASNELGNEEENLIWIVRGPFIVSAGSARFQEIVAQSLRSWEEPPVLAIADIRLLQIARASLAGLASQKEPSGVLRAGWESALKPEAQEFRCALTGLPGHMISAARARTETIIPDVVPVSGGTGFSIIEIVDPVAERISSGFAFLASVREVSGGKVELRWQGVLAQTDTSKKQKIAIPIVESFAPGAQPSAQPAQEPQASGARTNITLQEFELHEPHQQVRQWNSRVDVPPGRDAVLDVWTEGETAYVLVGSARIARP